MVSCVGDDEADLPRAPEVVPVCKVGESQDDDRYRFLQLHNFRATHSY